LVLRATFFAASAFFFGFGGDFAFFFDLVFLGAAAFFFVVGFLLVFPESDASPLVA
jgi:hypothetical protein